MAQKFATLEVRNKLQQRIADIDACKANPTAWNAIQDKQEFLSNEQRLRNTLSSVTPPDTTGIEKDDIGKRAELIRAALVNGVRDLIDPMPSERQCWENAPGTAGQILRWEGFWKRHTLDPGGNIVKCDRGKGAIWELKDHYRVLRKEAEGEDPDVGSLERIRPRDTADPLMDVHRRSYGFSPAFKEKYDEAFPDHKASDVEQKLDAAAEEQINRMMDRIAQLESVIEKKANRGKKSSERMKARWAQRKAAQNTTAQTAAAQEV